MGKKGAAASSSSDGGSGGKDKLGTCKEVNARHILCEKQSKILEVQQKLKEGWLDNGNKVPANEFAKLAEQFSDCSSKKRGGSLGWFGRGKMVGAFEQAAFNTQPFKTQHGYHIVLVEGRRN